MKLKYIIYLLSMLAGILVVVSCSKMNDLHEEYLEAGETIYAAQLDTVETFPGNGRVKIKMVALSQRVDKVRIFWNDYADSLDFSIDNQTGTFYEVISGLSEGEYIFHLITLDKFGDRSLPREVSSRVFGEQYASKLVNRGIQSMEYVGDDLVISWRSFVGSTGTEMVYENSEGATSSIFVPLEERTTTITDFKSDGVFSYQSYYVPAENAIDTFITAPIEGNFPHFIRYVECDKSKFAEMSLPNDLGRLGWDGNERLERIWDGSVGPQGYPWVFHGNDSHGVVTFDMGEGYDNLAFIEETGRDCCGNPLAFEVWGTDDIGEAETELRSDEAGWADEMIAKGWTLLKEVTRTDDGKQPYKVAIDEGAPTVKYIRINFTQTVDNQAVNLSEVTFWYQE